MNIVKTYRHNRRTVCYITERNGVYTVKTGKPSDTYCIAWCYNNLPDAMITAAEYLENWKG